MWAARILIEDNRLHGNSYDERRGGISIRDSRNALVRDNVLGAATVAGVSYQTNAERIAVGASDSGRADRTNLQNVDIVNNVLDGEVMVGCELPDEIVACSGNN
jgi:hypothetical protein